MTVIRRDSIVARGSKRAKQRYSLFKIKKKRLLDVRYKVPVERRELESLEELGGAPKPEPRVGMERIKNGV